MNEFQFLYDLPRVDFVGEGLHYLPHVQYGTKHPREYMECIFKDGLEKMPVLVWIHGGAWDDEYLTSNYRPERALARLAQEGFFVVSMEYRLTRHAKFPACFEDCQMLIQYIKEHAEEYHIDINKFALWGESAGAHIACMVGCNYNDIVGAKIQAVVSFYCPTDLNKQVQFTNGELGFVVNALPDKELKKEEIDEILKKYSPITYADKENLPPFLLFHGDKDDVVDFHESLEFCNKLKEAGNRASVILVPGQGHGFFVGDEYYDKVISFLKETLIEKYDLNETINEIR